MTGGADDEARKRRGLGHHGITPERADGTFGTEVAASFREGARASLRTCKCDPDHAVNRGSIYYVL
jgi:hypothetical protein